MMDRFFHTIVAVELCYGMEIIMMKGLRKGMTDLLQAFGARQTL